jgi:creatinine amidohydrolase
MLDMTVQELRQALRSIKTALIPVGLCEQHGYHLPLGTDIINAEQFARRIAERYPAVVAPSLNYNFSGGTLPGTINVHPHVITQLLNGVILSLYHTGFRRVGIVMGHGGSEAADAVKESLRFLHWLNPDHPDLQIIYIPVWDFSPSWMGEFHKQDYHAGKVETSLLLYWCPEKVRAVRPQDEPKVAAALREDPDSYQEWITRTDSKYEVPHTRQRPAIKVGVMGHPDLASAALGRKVTDEVVTGVAKLLRDLDRQARARRSTPLIRGPEQKMRLLSK